MVGSVPAANVYGPIPAQRATAHSRTGGLLVHSKSHLRPVILTCTGLLLPLAIIAATQAQAPPADDGKPPQVESPAAQSPFISERPPRPIAEVNAFIEGSSRTNDAAIEIRLGSSRLLTFKQPLAKPGGDNPVIAFSDSRIADFELLPNSRMLRLLGLRPGNSDLSITTSDGETYSFLVNVVFDLDVIRATVKEQFPTAAVSINQLREHLILTGQARSTVQSEEIDKTVGDLIPSKTPERVVEGGAGKPDDEIEVRIVNLLEVVYDLDAITATIAQLYPDASVRVTQVRENVVLTGEAVSSRQSSRIVQSVETLLPAPQSADLRILNELSIRYDLDHVNERIRELFPDATVSITQHIDDVLLTGQVRSTALAYELEETMLSLIPKVETEDFRVLNRLQIPGAQQVMLRVQVAELNRTAMREIGASFLFSDSNSIITSPVGGALQIAPGVQDSSTLAANGLSSMLTTLPGATATAIGIFDASNFAVLFRALRDNAFMRILAEPNLVAINGEDASFLAGGEFPIAVPQQNGVNTVEFRRFGVNLDFTPTIYPDDTIRLRVAPEVSSLDFSIGVTLSPGASPIPGLNSRSADTTVELREGQTLMMAGLLQVEISAQTQRVPGLGDMPVLGSFFRNSTSRNVEKELVVMVTPYIVDAVDEEDAPALPGDDINEANEREFFLYGRIESCAAGFRSTTDYPRCREMIRIESRFVQGPHGYSNCDNCR